MSGLECQCLLTVHDSRPRASLHCMRTQGRANTLTCVLADATQHTCSSVMAAGEMCVTATYVLNATTSHARRA